ncbi:hypothetical protein F5887DRAFT_916001 [Amanita rubescens]|nr:hypothetical protein F5887DRAFT_916001 [Amanita rubescens]
MATASSPSTPTLNIRSTMGAILLGAVGAAMLYGVTNVQIYFYARKYQRDRMFLKYIVVFLWMMDTLHIAFIIAGLWHYLIDSFGNYQALLPVTWSHKAQQFLSMVIVLTVQSLYALRIWRLSSHRKHRIWPWIVSAFLACGYAMLIALVVKTYKLNTWRESDDIGTEIILAFAICTSNDFLLAAGICHLVFLSKPNFGTHRRTNSMIRIIMRYVLISGLLTSMCSLAGLICYCVMPNNFISLALSLNARESIRNRGTVTQKTLQLSSLEIRASLSHNLDDSDNTAAETTRNRGQRTTEGEDRTVASPMQAGKDAHGQRVAEG